MKAEELRVLLADYDRQLSDSQKQDREEEGSISSSLPLGIFFSTHDKSQTTITALRDLVAGNDEIIADDVIQALLEQCPESDSSQNNYHTMSLSNQTLAIIRAHIDLSVDDEVLIHSPIENAVKFHHYCPCERAEKLGEAIQFIVGDECSYSIEIQGRCSEEFLAISIPQKLEIVQKIYELIHEAFIDNLKDICSWLFEGFVDGGVSVGVEKFSPEKIQRNAECAASKNVRMDGTKVTIKIQSFGIGGLSHEAFTRSINYDSFNKITQSLQEFVDNQCTMLHLV